MSHKITVEGGSSVRLPTKGKYCDRDIVVTAASGGAELPELTNPGTAEDMLEGKELIDGDGNIVTGTMQTVIGSVTGQVAPGFAYNIGPCVRMQYSPTERLMLEPDTSYVDLVAPLSDFGDATAADVAKGKTFTSAEGLLVTGTLHDNGKMTVSGSNPTVSSFAGGTVIRLSNEVIEDFIIRAGTQIANQVSASAFGDATAADVAKGKTFTSAAGLLAVGTKEEDGMYAEAGSFQLASVAQSKTVALSGFTEAPKMILLWTDEASQAAHEKYYILLDRVYLADNAPLTLGGSLLTKGRYFDTADVGEIITMDTSNNKYAVTVSASQFIIKGASSYYRLGTGTYFWLAIG